MSGQVSITERPGVRTEDLSSVVVYLEPSGGAASVTADAGVVTLQGRQFTPRVRVVTVGSTILFANQDPFNHNVFSKAAQGPFDTQSYTRGVTRANVFRGAGVYPIYCNVHPRMTGYVIAVKTPYHAQAGADGRFVLPDVPPGRYRITVWHDRAPELTEVVSVDATGLRGLRYVLDARSYSRIQHKNKFGRAYATSGDVY